MKPKKSRRKPCLVSPLDRMRIALAAGHCELTVKRIYDRTHAVSERTTARVVAAARELGLPEPRA